MKLYTLIAALALAVLLPAAAMAEATSGTITYDISLQADKGAKQAALWMPYPLSDQHQTISQMQITGNFATRAVYRDPRTDAVYLYAAWDAVTETPQLRMSFHAAVKDRSLPPLKASAEPLPADLQKFLASSPCLPVDDAQIREIALKATAGKKDVLEKARAVYDWVVENTFRDPEVKGCGLGVPGLTLGRCKGGGKCADISSVFVAVARAAGIPARDVYGLRLAEPKTGEITSAFHCWAEFYLPGTGWVPADPADVRKMMLVHKLELKDAGAWREFFWGGDDLFRVVLGRDSRCTVFEPAQQGSPVNYFMYPYAEVDGVMLNYFDPASFTYTVSFTAD